MYLIVTYIVFLAHLTIFLRLLNFQFRIIEQTPLKSDQSLLRKKIKEKREKMSQDLDSLPAFYKFTISICHAIH